MMNKQKICIYHDKCMDGFGAAYAVWKKYADKDIEYVGGVHGTTPPDCTGKDVIMVDFSYPKEVMNKIADECNEFLLLDHHLSAFKSIGNVKESIEVPLSNGKVSLVDKTDIHLINQYSWS